MTTMTTGSASTGSEQIELLRRSSLFGNLDDRDLEVLAPQFEACHLDTGDLLFAQGEEADALYLLAEGALDVQAHGPDGRWRSVGRIGAGQCVGEMAVVYSGRRTATVRAEAPCRLLRLSKTAFGELVAANPEIGTTVRGLLTRRLPALRGSTSELFGDVDDALLRELESRFTWHVLRRGEVLFRQGEIGDRMYLVVHGRMQVLVASEGVQEHVVADIGPGEWIGEMALFLDEPRSATVRAVRDSELVGLSRADFDTVIEHHPQCLRPIVNMLARRLKATTHGQRQSTGAPLAVTIAVVPLAADLPPIPPHLLEELAESGSVLALDATRFDAIHGAGAAACPLDDTRSGYLNEWLSQQEEAYRYVIYETGAAPNAWALRCMRHADRILYLARADDDPEMREIEHLYERENLLCPRELVLLHPADRTHPRGTARWLDARTLERHHHIRKGNYADVQRVARLLTGRASGLVLSGGGARGFAHIGVIRALTEAGLRFDSIAGTSIGAFIGSLYACDLDEAEIIARVRRVLVDPPRGIHYGVPYTSLMRVEGATRKVREMYDDLALEDLWMPFFCISTSLTKVDMKVHRRGPAWKAMRATTAVPGIFPPVIDGDEVLVDGGIVNNLPVELMSASGVKHIAACDVTRAGTLSAGADWRERATLADVLLNLVNPRRHPVPAVRMPHLINRCMDTASRMRKRQEMWRAQLYLAPPISSYPLLAMQEFNNLVEIGYTYTREVLEKTSGAVLERFTGT